IAVSRTRIHPACPAPARHTRATGARSQPVGAGRDLVVECPSMTEPFDRSAAMMPSMRRLAPQLVVAGVLPLVGYVLLRPHVGSDATALAAVMVFPLLDIVIERHRHGRFEPIGIISLIGIAVGIVGAVVFHGNATLLKVRESL